MGDRLYELAYAIAMGGRAAQAYAGPIYELLGRKVESWAPRFGMLELPPTRMCPVLEYIGGEEARLAVSKPPCGSQRKSQRSLAAPRDTPLIALEGVHAP
jgi:hypothetical protein